MEQEKKKPTSLTKPAGCFLQVLGPILIVLGIGFSGGDHAILGIALIVLGGWLFYQGGRPAREKAAFPAIPKEKEEKEVREADQPAVVGTQRREFNPELLSKKCPDCAENIKLEALVCRFCSHKFAPEEVQAAIQQAKQQFEREHAFTPEDREKLSRGLCPNCDAYQAFTRDMTANRLKCTVCGKGYPLE